MDWDLVSVSFIAVFLSELGDKSQIAAIVLSGSSKSPQAVFFGTAGALLLSSLMGVLLGEGVGQFLPTQVLKGMAAIGFATIGLQLLWPKDA